MSAATTEGDVRKDFSIEKPEWAKVEDGTYNVDHVINAYLSGQEKALSRFANAVEKVSDQNLVKSMGLIDEFLEVMRSKAIVNFAQARLSQPEFNVINAIIILEKEAFLSEKLDEVYDLYFQFEDKLDLDFEFTLKFTFADERINYEQMSLDGYRYFRTPS